MDTRNLEINYKAALRELESEEKLGALVGAALAVEQRERDYFESALEAAGDLIPVDFAAVWNFDKTGYRVVREKYFADEPHPKIDSSAFRDIVENLCKNPDGILYESPRTAESESGIHICAYSPLEKIAVTIVRRDTLFEQFEKERFVFAQDFMARAFKNLKSQETRESISRNRESAESALKARNRFLAGMSHAFRTPLNAILGFSQLLSGTENLDRRQMEWVAAIRQSGKKLLSLVNDALDLAGLESSDIAVFKNKFNLLDLIRDLREFAEIEIEYKNVSFKTLIDQDLPKFVRGDEKRIKQSISALLNNAMKFVEQGSITLKTELAERSGDEYVVAFEIADTGVGINEEILRKINSDNLDLSEELTLDGPGIGLSIAKKIIDRLGGGLKIRSNRDRGSIVTATFQLKAAEPDTPAVKKSFDDIVGYSGKPIKTMIVDDHWENRFVIKSMIGALGFEIVEADSAARSIEKAAQFRPDVIFMDHILPDASGEEAAAEIKKNAEGKVFVIAVTGAALNFSKIREAKSGYDDFIIKPVNRDILLFKMQKLLGFKWDYGESKNTPPEPKREKDIVFPKSEYAERIYDLALRGDVRGIEIVLSEIADSDGKYSGFVEKIRSLACVYKMKQIRKFLKDSE